MYRGSRETVGLLKRQSSQIISLTRGFLKAILKSSWP